MTPVRCGRTVAHHGAPWRTGAAGLSPPLAHFGSSLERAGEERASADFSWQILAVNVNAALQVRRGTTTDEPMHGGQKKKKGRIRGYLSSFI